ncbi:MAG: Ig-like domain-containing protein [Candidatus Hydrogenedentota bacterium]|nr:MAG: Ig-like domain-containing protein [Candidatus Hydrogenedentota bacterium]
MSDFKYTPDEEIAIHRIGAIKHMCRSFLSHENGLPELVKNSALAYLRENRKQEDRVIVLLFARARGQAGAKVGCLDFVGMTSEQIERDFKQWADPGAAMRESGSDVRVGELGGHGHGGKCYMTQMFRDYALLHTVRNSRGCVYGVAGGSSAFGYAPNVKDGRDFPVEDVPGSIDGILGGFGISLSHLPDAAREAGLQAKGFTLVSGVRPKEWAGTGFVENLLESLLGHHQMITALQLCQIFAVENGQVLNSGNALSLPEIDPMPGFEEARVIEVPVEVRDPISGRRVATKAEELGGGGKLMICTSEKNMRLGRGARRQWRHTVNFHTTASGIIGKISMLALNVDSSYRDYMYCDCYLDSLDGYQQNDRGPLAESPLTRAVETWIGGQVREYCREFEARERQQIRQHDKDQLSRINEWLDRWKNQFMEELTHGVFGEGNGGAVEPWPTLPLGMPSSIEVTTSYPRAGVGVYMRPVIKIYDCNGRRIRPVPFRWMSEDNNVAMVDEDLMQIRTFAPGSTKIWAETLDRRVKSNEVPLEVVRIDEIRITPHELEMPAGARRRLEAVCTLRGGSEVSGIHLTWLEDDSGVARVSSSGLVFGVRAGETKVTAIDESCRSDTPAKIVVIPGTGRGGGTQGGRGYPKVLVSEVDTAPDEELPAVFRRDEPPVMQRVQDVATNIWWINLASPFARFYFSDSSYGVQSEAWRMYHVERYIDIIVQIALTNGPDRDETFTSTNWMYRAGEIEAEIRGKAIESLGRFICSGEIEM